MDARRVVAGFAVAVLLLAVLVVGFGGERVLWGLRQADATTFALAPAGTLLAVACWGLALYRLTRPVPGAPSGMAFVGAYATGVLLRNLAPWGRSGGSLLMAAALDRAGGTRYEELLGATATSEFLGSVGSVTVAGTGLAALLASGEASEGVVAAAVVFGGFVAVLALAAVVVVALPEVVVRVAALLLAGLRGVLGRVWPAADRYLVSVAPVERVERLLETVRRIARDPGTLLPAAGFTVAAAMVSVGPLWLSLRAVDAAVAIPTLMVVLPLSGFAGVVPLPGGTGGVEFALVGLLVAATSLEVATLAAGVLLYRLSTYWFTLAVGGVGAVGLAGGVRLEDYPD